VEQATKTCRRCDVTKPRAEFRKRGGKRCPNGLASWCKVCQAAYLKEYQAKNREKLAAQRHAFYEANRDRILAQQKEYNGSRHGRARQAMYNRAKHSLNKHGPIDETAKAMLWILMEDPCFVLRDVGRQSRSHRSGGRERSRKPHGRM
jgi:hypothetical protein